MKASLSVSMIVRNESAHICTALENLREFAGEVVVLDTGSTDDTKRLAAECGAVVRDFVWCDDFAKARNVSLSYCTKQFVMWLDADDRIPREDALRLRELLQGEPDWDVLHLPCLYSRSGRKMPARIFRNGIDIHWIYPIHEILSIPKNLRIKRDVDDICVYHDWNRPPGAHSARHLRILEKAIQQPEYQNSSYMLWHIAKEYSGLGERAKAIHFYWEAIRNASPGAGFMLARQYHGLARQYMRVGQPSPAAEAFGKAGLFYPNWREPYCGMADALWMLGDPHAARVCVELAQNIPRHRMTLERSQLYDEAVFASQYVEKARRLVKDHSSAAQQNGAWGRLPSLPDWPTKETEELTPGSPGRQGCLPHPDIAQSGRQGCLSHGTLVAAGDVWLGGEMGDFVARHGSDWPLCEVSPLFQAADVTLVNLQCVVGRGGTAVKPPGPGAPPYYRADPGLLEVLREAGMGAVAAANEQAMGYGPEALREQASWLAPSAIRSYGSGASLLDAAAPCYCEAGGTVVAMIGIDTLARQAAATATAAGINHAQGRQRVLQRLAVSIAEARNRADLIVVTPHWEAGKQEQPTEDERRLAHSIIDLGADAVLGYSAQMLNCVEVYAGCPIVYDMGTLLCDCVGDGRRRLSAVFALPFGRDGFQQLRVHPVLLEPGRARRAEGKECDEICELLTRLSASLGTTGWERDGDFMSLPLGPRRKRARTGAAGSAGWGPLGRSEEHLTSVIEVTSSGVRERVGGPAMPPPEQTRGPRTVANANPRAGVEAPGNAIQPQSETHTPPDGSRSALGASLPTSSKPPTAGLPESGDQSVGSCAGSGGLRTGRSGPTSRRTTKPAGAMMRTAFLPRPYRGDAVIAFPPVSLSVAQRGPYLAGPLLAAFLSQSGFQAASLDLNIRFFRYLSTGPVFEEEKR